MGVVESRSCEVKRSAYDPGTINSRLGRSFGATKDSTVEVASMCGFDWMSKRYVAQCSLPRFNLRKKERFEEHIHRDQDQRPLNTRTPMLFDTRPD